MAGATLLAAPALAQRGPADTEARASGKIGEQADGYLGIVGTAVTDLKQVADDVNNKRRAVYSQKAQQNSVTLEAYALTSGCDLILRTQPGEMYRTPEGKWKTRTSDKPERDPRCP